MKGNIIFIPGYPIDTESCYEKNGIILSDEADSDMRRLGHIITVNWANDKVSIVSQLSLFNQNTYAISLAKDFSGQKRNIKRGHFFNVHSKEILSLGAK